MGEPMEDGGGAGRSADGGGGDEDAQKGTLEEESPQRNSRNMVMMAITPKDYETKYWPELKSAIDQLLRAIPGQYLPLSYEQVYSCVYKCVCKQLSERLYEDLMKHITNHLETLSVQLQSHAGTDCRCYIEKFGFSLNQYLQALQGIVPVFNYLNRFYIELKLKQDLTAELKKLFVKFVADRHIDSLISLLDNVHLRPLSISPSVISTLIINLHKIRPEYAQLRPQLFARYIPNILPPCSINELNQYKQEVQQMQRDLLTHPEFFSGDQGRKRPCEDDLSLKVPETCLSSANSSWQ